MLKSLSISNKVTLTPDNRVAIIPYTTEDNYIRDIHEVIERILSNVGVAKSQIVFTGNIPRGHQLSEKYDIQFIDSELLRNDFYSKDFIFISTEHIPPRLFHPSYIDFTQNYMIHLCNCAVGWNNDICSHDDVWNYVVDSFH